MGSISPTYLRTAITPVAPKSIRIQSSCQYLFTLLGSIGAKAARRMLMKFTDGYEAEKLSNHIKSSSRSYKTCFLRFLLLS